jgi:hypothetical protein
MSAVWESALTDNPSELLVLLTLADHADDDGENAYPGIARIAHRCRLGTRRVQQILRGLEGRGLIRIDEQAGGSYGVRSDRRPNRYTLIIDGVKPTAPRGVDGVKYEAEKEPHGVKPTSPDPLVISTSISKDEKSSVSHNSKTSDESKRLAELLADLMVENGCKKPVVTDKWIATIEKIHRIDGREYDQIERAIRWSQCDPFWSANVHSPEALRRHYEKMRMQASRKPTGRTALDGVGDYLREMNQ